MAKKPLPVKKLELPKPRKERVFNKEKFLKLAAELRRIAREEKESGFYVDGKSDKYPEYRF